MEAATATATSTETCKTCGQAFDPELDDNCEWIEIEVGEDYEEAVVCGTCAPPYVPPAGYYELRDGVLGWVEDGEWEPVRR